jgi:hypothetical protein
MDTETLRTEVKRVFIPIKKPSGFAISFHKVGCAQCEYLRKDLEVYRDRLLPSEAIQYMHGEMSCLSAKGRRWVLPSYLDHCLTADSTTDHDQATKFLIYNLGPDLKYQKETMQRLSLLNLEQVTCLIHFLEWCAQHAFWSTYCLEDINKGLAFMRALRHNHSLETDR